MTKLVHIDLKGAQFLPCPDGGFWEAFCTLLAKWGVSGLLLEWEDSVRIPTLASDPVEFAYTREQAEWVVGTARKNNLQVVPLVQTFGHMEFVLKCGARKSLREVEDFPNCLVAIDASDGDADVAFQLVSSLVDDIVALTPDCPAIHLGGDEVWHLGSGPKSLARLSRNPNLTRDLIYLEHMSKVIDHVKRKYPDKRILIWDDMLRKIPEETIKFGADSLVRFSEPVVWNYSPEPEQSLDDSLWQKYSRLFPAVWIATAFKGNMNERSFELGWLKLLEQKKDIFPQNLGGIILTGWQRFDHFASLCELMPVGIPSLCCCLAALEAGNFGDSELAKCSNELGLDLGAELRDEAPTNLHPNFPGSELYILVRSFVRLRTAYDSFMNSDVLTTWFSDHQVRRTGRVSPLQLQYIATRFRDLLLDFRQLERALQTALSVIYPLPVCHEWLGTYVEPIVTVLSRNVERTNVIARQIRIST